MRRHAAARAPVLPEVASLAAETVRLQRRGINTRSAAATCGTTRRTRPRLADPLPTPVPGSPAGALVPFGCCR